MAMARPAPVKNLMSKPVLLIRADGNEPDAEALGKLGIESVTDPYIVIERTKYTTDALALLTALKNAEPNTWLLATSVNAIRCWAELIGLENLKAAASNPNLKFAAVGERTAKALLEIGAKAVATPEVADSASLAEALIQIQQDSATTTGSGTASEFTAIIPSGLLAMKGLPSSLTQAGWKLITGVVYTTVIKPSRPQSADGAAGIVTTQAGESEFSAVIFRSPSAARAFLEFVPNPPASLALIAAGITTAKVIEDAGLTLAGLPLNPTPEAVAQAVKTAIF